MIFFFCWTFQFMHFSLLHAPPSFPRDAFRHAGGGADAADHGPSSPQTFCLLCSCREPRRGRTPFPAEPGLALCAGGCDLCGQGALGGGRELGRWWQWQAADGLPEVLPQGAGLLLPLMHSPPLHPARHTARLVLTALCPLLSHQRARGKYFPLLPSPRREPGSELFVGPWRQEECAEPPTPPFPQPPSC